jgi:hypothetical protein
MYMLISIYNWRNPKVSGENGRTVLFHQQKGGKTTPAAQVKDSHILIDIQVRRQFLG